MSYEGYEVFVCPSGHRWSRDAYYVFEDGDDDSCPHCGKAPAWTCSVDQTNNEYMEPELKVAHDAPTCGSCGQTTGPVCYVVPGAEVKAVHTRPEGDETR